MNDKTKLRIEDYIQSVFRGFEGDPQELEELKEEMRVHLLEAVKELQEEGLSEEAGVSLALERFGSGKQLQHEMLSTLSVQHVFARRLLYVSMAFALIGVLIFGYFFAQEQLHMAQKSKLDTGVWELLKGQTEITPQLREQLDRLASENLYGTEYIALFRAETLLEDPFPTALEKAVYLYPRDAVYDEYHGAGGGSGPEWAMQSQTDPALHTGYRQGWSLPFFAVYWVLFALWGIITAYHQRRLSLAWVLLFSLLNFAGYALFRFRRRWGG
ncbi:permease prefix domain 1-containing protein [Paenibacillus silviterrae]|uniref:permease prefix domain 1-containing protein n=1 Tax=Paenibacillus silviterrae TaxID=3242194 RepID=UPI002543A756|nr:permease prefix domain 1-containing protein [Paenibacillus chinjuensis]